MPNIPIPFEKRLNLFIWSFGSGGSNYKQDKVKLDGCQMDLSELVSRATGWGVGGGEGGRVERLFRTQVLFLYCLWYMRRCGPTVSREWTQVTSTYQCGASGINDSVCSCCFGVSTMRMIWENSLPIQIKTSLTLFLSTNFDHTRIGLVKFLPDQNGNTALKDFPSVFLPVLPTSTRLGSSYIRLG